MSELPALRVLAFDFGTKRIGAAFGQSLSNTAQELAPLKAQNGTPDWGEVAEYLQQWQPGLLLIGLPLHKSGAENPMSRKARNFGQCLYRHFRLPCEMVDERFSSVQAYSELQERSGSGHSVDSAAARLVLEEWLEALALQTRNLQHRLGDLQQRIAAAARRQTDPPAEIRLLGVCKGQSAGMLYSACRAGVRDFGENYINEALRKMGVLGGDCTRHFLGSIQSNKSAALAANFDWIHSLCREKIALRLSAARDPQHAMQVCLQINFDREEQKSGIHNWRELQALAEQVIALPGLQLRGLMALPPAQREPEQQYVCCMRIAEVFTRLREAFPQIDTIDTLSLGTSMDFEPAIRAGATSIRIGTELFGKRSGAKLP